MARPAVQGSPVDFSAVAATTATSGTVSSLQAGDLILVFVGMRSASARNVTSITDTIAASGDLAWDHASDDDGGVSNNLRDAQNVQQAELWRAYVQPGDNTSGTITVNVSASTSTLYCRAVVIRATAGGTLSIDQHASADQGATDTDPGTVSITPTVDSLVVAFSGNRQDQFVDFDGTLTAIGSPAEAGSLGDQMDWHAGYVDGTASTPQTCTFDYAAVSEWIVQAVSVEETAAGGAVHERAAAVAGNASIATAGLFWTTFERSTAVIGAAAIAVVGQRTLVRSSALTATAQISATGRRTLQRTVTVTGAPLIATAGTFWTTFQRSAAITGTATISVAGQRALQRGSSVSGSPSIQVAGSIAGGPVTRSRAASLTGSPLLAVSGQFWSILERSIAVTGSPLIAVTGQTESSAGTHERSVALTGVPTVTVTGRRALIRRAAVMGVASVTATGLTVRSRAVSLTGQPVIAVSGSVAGPIQSVGSVEGTSGASGAEGTSTVVQSEASGEAGIVEAASGVLVLIE